MTPRREPKKCSFCGATDHNANNCILKYSNGSGTEDPKKLIPGNYFFYHCRTNPPESIPDEIIKSPRSIDLEPNSKTKDTNKLFFAASDADLDVVSDKSPKKSVAKNDNDGEDIYTNDVLLCLAAN